VDPPGPAPTTITSVRSLIVTRRPGRSKNKDSNLPSCVPIDTTAGGFP